MNEHTEKHLNKICKMYFITYSKLQLIQFFENYVKWNKCQEKNYKN